jgi:hypothetical protein
VRPDGAGLELRVLRADDVAGVGELLAPAGGRAAKRAPHHHGPTRAETLTEVEAVAERGGGWVLLEKGRPRAVLARAPGGDAGYELLDFVVAQGEEPTLAWALAEVTAAVRAASRRPAAVIDALDPVRRRIFRNAGYYTAAAYLVFYDPLAGRPSVPTVTRAELQAMMEGNERFRLVDVLGEEHWKEAHLPGSEWIDFRSLGREARRRFKPDETIVVYCSGFT